MRRDYSASGGRGYVRQRERGGRDLHRSRGGPGLPECVRGDVDIDLKELLGSLADDPITVCVAQYLPEGATVDSLDVVPGGATAHLSAKDFVLDEDSLNTLGSCS